MHDTNRPFEQPAYTTRDTVKLPLMRWLPPVEPAAIMWEHVCTLPDRKGVAQATRAAASLATITSLCIPLVLLPGLSAIANPIVAVGALASTITGSCVPWLVSVGVWVVGLASGYARRRRARLTNNTTFATSHPDSTTNVEWDAIREEHLFREGAEHWTWWQQLWANFLFGLAHSPSVVFAFWPPVLVRAWIGYFLMRAYLQEYAQSGSRKKALHCAAQLHFACNWAADLRSVYLWAQAATFLMGSGAVIWYYSRLW